MSGGIAQLLTSALEGGVWSASHLGRLYPGKDPVPIVQEAGWAPEPVRIGAENLAPPGFDPRTFRPVASRGAKYAEYQMLLVDEASSVNPIDFL